MRRRYMHGIRRRRSPLKQYPKKSTESVHGQLSDAELEYKEDLKFHKPKGTLINPPQIDHSGGVGFVNAPYRDPQGTGPTEKRKGYHGYKKTE